MRKSLRKNSIQGATEYFLNIAAINKSWYINKNEHYHDKSEKSG